MIFCFVMLKKERKSKMGAMLRQVLKAFCAGNQWCYAVFWKIGCQNTK